jgi:5,10-methylenetetrahydromethanopterin reductase
MTEAARRTIDLIALADQAGLDSVWLSEDPDGWDAFGVLCAAAQRTQSIRLGTGVTNPYMRHPNLIAMSVSTLDRLSDGRAFLGLGRGQPEWYRDRLDVEPRPPLAALEDTINLLRQWWSPSQRASARNAFQISDWARAIGPEQERVPIYLAALGPKSLELASRVADGLLIADFASIPFLEWLVPFMRESLERHGRDPDGFHFYARTAIQVTDNPAPALERRKNLLALLAPLPGMSRQIELPPYDVDALVKRLRRVMHTEEVLATGGNFIDIRKVADFGEARRIIPDDVIEQLSFIGPAPAIREKLARVQQIGVTHVFVTPLSQENAEDFAAKIDAIRA